MFSGQVKLIINQKAFSVTDVEITLKIRTLKVSKLLFKMSMQGPNLHWELMKITFNLILWLQIRMLTSSLALKLINSNSQEALIIFKNTVISKLYNKKMKWVRETDRQHQLGESLINSLLWNRCLQDLDHSKEWKAQPI
jgi:hypothetical protein